MTALSTTDRLRDLPRAPGMGSAVAAEFAKLGSVPAQRALHLAAVVLAAVVAVVFYLSLPVTQGRSVSELGPDEVLETGMLGVDAAAFVLIIVAAIHVGSEYSTGMIVSTLILTPARSRVLAAKLVTVAIASLAVGAVAAAVCLGVALIVAGAHGIGPGLLLSAAGIQLVLGSLAMPVLYAVIAACAAFVGRSAAAGMVVPVILMAAGGVAGWFGPGVSASATPLLPVAAIHSLSGVATGPESIGLAGAAVSLVAWIGISVGAAAWRLFRRDA